MSVDSGSIQGITRETLLRERAAVVTRMRSMTQDALNLEGETDGVPPSGYEREQALTAMLDNRLADIDGALERIEAGTYGVCRDCSRDIPPRRLEAQPFAVLCVNCQSEVEKKVRRRVH